MTTQYSQKKAGSPQRVSVYLLTFRSGKSYVGIARNLRVRLNQHRISAEKGKQYAISCAWRKYGQPEVRVLVTALTLEDAFVVEKEKIVELGTKAPLGYNMTDGGEGFCGVSEDILKENARKRSKRFREDSVFRERMRAATRAGAKKGAITRKKFNATPEGQAIIKARTNQQWREKVSKKNRERVLTPEQVRKASEVMKELWRDPEYRNKVNAARDLRQKELREANGDWVKQRMERMSKSMKERWQDPKYREKVLARPAPIVSEEARRRAAATRKANMTPEKRAKIAEKTRQQWAKRKQLQQELSQDTKTENLVK